MSSTALELIGNILYIEKEVDNFYIGFILNKYGRVYVEVPVADCDELEV